MEDVCDALFKSILSSYLSKESNIIPLKQFVGILESNQMLSSLVRLFPKSYRSRVRNILGSVRYSANHESMSKSRPTVRLEHLKPIRFFMNEHVLIIHLSIKKWRNFLKDVDLLQDIEK